MRKLEKEKEQSKATLRAIEKANFKKVKNTKEFKSGRLKTIRYKANVSEFLSNSKDNNSCRQLRAYEI